jgi:hypothetical protein
VQYQVNLWQGWSQPLAKKDANHVANMANIEPASSEIPINNYRLL